MHVDDYGYTFFFLLSFFFFFLLYIPVFFCAVVVFLFIRVYREVEILVVLEYKKKLEYLYYFLCIPKFVFFSLFTNCFFF